MNDILDAASMRKGKLVVKHERVALPNLLDDIIDLTQPLARGSVKILNQMPVGLPSVVGDPSRIIQIFYNLIGNATKFTHAGRIWVTAKVATAAQSDTALPPVKVVEVTVHDTGIGIPEEKFGSIFEAFEQVDQSTTRKYGGTGLGLTLVKQLVEAHDGTIRISSELGKGTSFTFTLREWSASLDDSSQAPQKVEEAKVAVEEANDTSSAQHQERITAGESFSHCDPSHVGTVSLSDSLALSFSQLPLPPSTIMSHLLAAPPQLESLLAGHPPLGSPHALPLAPVLVV